MKEENTLYCQHYHQQEKTSLLLLHGGGSAGWMWQAVVERLPEYHCLVADLPEHGGSMHVKPFSMELAAQKAAEVIQAEAHDGRAVVIGLSEGAQVVVQMLASTPEVMEGAFISSALILPMPGGKMYTSRGVITALFRMSVLPFRNTDWWIRLNMKYAAGIPEVYYAQFKKNFQEMTEDQFVNLMTANQTFRMPEGITKAQIPVLICYGKHEYKAMKKSAQKLAHSLGVDRVYQIDLGEGSTLAGEHNWAMTAPQAFADAVRDWMGRQPLPSILS